MRQIVTLYATPGGLIFNGRFSLGIVKHRKRPQPKAVSGAGV